MGNINNYLVKNNLMSVTRVLDRKYQVNLTFFIEVQQTHNIHIDRKVKTYNKVCHKVFISH